MIKRILLADNDEAFLKTRREILEDAGYQVIPAASPEEAKRVLDAGNIDLAILDNRLEDNNDQRDISGLTLAKRSNPQIPKILLTEYPTYDLVREALGADLDGLPAAVKFVAKREGSEALLRAVRDSLKIFNTWFRATQDEITRQLYEDYERARKEANIHYWVSLTMSLVFAVPIIAGLILVLSGQTSLGVITTISGVVVEIVNMLFSSRLDYLHKRVDSYHEELLQSKRLENLLSACNDLAVELNKEKSIMQIIQQTTDGWMKPSVRRRPTGKTTRRRRPKSEAGQEQAE
ncbi:MAG TPA: response regulator [Blastocatellia bacterium]|nr:response regulator [Blastocatellia bacterium]